ncbi:MAG: basic amino acid ABC transporter substrate-binding protein [Sumerlaeia bacterium]
MSPRFLTYCCLALTLFVTGCGSGDSDAPSADPNAGGKALRVGMNPAFPPLEYVDESGEIVGFEVDLTDALGEELGREIEYVNVAWNGIFGALTNGNIDLIVSAVTITDERKERYLFSDPYIEAGQVLVVRAGDREKYPDLASLSGAKVGAILNTTGHIKLQESEEIGEVVAYENAGLTFLDLMNGNVEAIMMDKPVADYFASQKPESAGKLAVVGDLYTDEQFGIVARPGDAALIRDVNAALETLRANGTYDRIYARWFGEREG